MTYSLFKGLNQSILLQSSQRRIDFDSFSRGVSANRNCEDYEKALYQIQRNSSSRSLNKRFIEEKKERELEERLVQVGQNYTNYFLI